MKKGPRPTEAVFNVAASFLVNEDRFVQEVEAIEL